MSEYFWGAILQTYLFENVTIISSIVCKNKFFLFFRNIQLECSSVATFSESQGLAW